MPTIDAHDPGTICWIDLASTDAAGATEFYCELFGWTATRADRERGRLPHAAARRPPGGRAGARVGRHRRLELVDLRRERRRRPDVRRRDRERRRGRDGRDGRARRRPHGGAARPGGRPGLGLAAGRAPGLRGARRAGHADLERADDARHRGRRAFYGSVFGWTSQSRSSTACPYTVWKRARAARRRRARDGRDAGPRRRSRTGWSTSRRPTATRPRGAAASSAAPSGTRRTTSAPAAARCSRTRRAARSRSSRCARRT